MLMFTVLDPLGVAQNLDFEFTFPFTSHAPMETNTAIADVREDSAEFWGGLKIPIIALQDMAQQVGMSEDQVTVHVVPGGGSFGGRSRRSWGPSRRRAAMASCPSRWRTSREPRT